MGRRAAGRRVIPTLVRVQSLLYGNHIYIWRVARESFGHEVKSKPLHMVGKRSVSTKEKSVPFPLFGVCVVSFLYTRFSRAVFCVWRLECCVDRGAHTE